jgi:hypothetical protein
MTESQGADQARRLWCQVRPYSNKAEPIFTWAPATKELSPAERAYRLCAPAPDLLGIFGAAVRLRADTVKSKTGK